MLQTPPAIHAAWLQLALLFFVEGTEEKKGSLLVILDASSLSILSAKDRVSELLH